ncbi:capsid cement protein [Tardiphaga sp.]|uniref:capsid cement protein n=1 Tax=Tardiphaga sp. TaxID=1926292 RepID=UPI0026016A3A|nr:capsid cement protein [Tardiphaga sp.]MDB5621387.1 manA [Tardiphaga sp.]
MALLLNRVTVRKGEVVYLPAGNIHSYLHGLGIEVLAASDNVLRGGLTPKHVDVPELLHVLDFRPLPVPFLRPSEPTDGVRVFQPDVPDFELVVIEPAGGSASFTPAGDALLLCTEGSFAVSSATGERVAAKGQSLYVSADEGEFTFTGNGTVFIATSNAAAESAVPLTNIAVGAPDA